MIRRYIRQAWRTILPLLYARTRFKLFLKASFADIDLRVQQLASVADYFSTLLRPIPIRAPFGGSMLVIAPHQDDEIIGCGGALALQVRAGRGAFVVILQDGADGHDELGMERQDLVALRNEESRRAAAQLGIEAPLFLGYADLTANMPAATEQLRRIIADRKVDAIFTPFVLDGHPDHRAANYILAGALRDIGWNVRVFGYEVWGLAVPNVIVVIDDVMEQKLAMLSCFDFANKAVDYVQSTRGLNMYHSRLLGSGMCKYAECYFEIPRLEYVELTDRVRAAERPRG
ncbi:MAG: PIG-L deacetylase family protein [Bryobacteraceae bacterium]|jgi:LmbE family N-acetylglucosaminyl deacetylase